MTINFIVNDNYKKYAEEVIKGTNIDENIKTAKQLFKAFVGELQESRVFPFAAGQSFYTRKDVIKNMPEPVRVLYGRLLKHATALRIADTVRTRTA